MAEQAVPVPKARYKIPGLDGIRGLSVLSLFIFHADIVPHFPGALATTVFFFLSGYLITTLFVREFQKTGDVDLGAFYVRRAIRIFPPLYLVLLIALVVNLGLHVGDNIAPWKVAGHFLQYTNYAMAGPRSLVGFLPGMLLLWSLAVDEHFYLLVAPFFRWGATRFSLQKVAKGILVVCGVILAWRCYVYSQEGYASVRIAVASDTRMDSILWGCFFALWRNPALEPEKAKPLAARWLVVLGVVGLLLPVITRSDLIKGTVLYTLQGLALIPLFSAAILHGKLGHGPGTGSWQRLSNLPVGQILEGRFLMWMSQISYPFYLFSGLILDILLHYLRFNRLLIALVSFGITLGLASLMHVYMERPLMQLKKRKARAPSEAAPETNETSLPIVQAG